jgi:two-component system, LuxR family, response regulator FixJ
MTETVSLVDDDPDVLDAVGMLLRARGHKVECYSSAKALLEAPPVPGCIVSDVRMPDVTGLDLLREVVAKGDLRPLIFLTGHGDVEMAVQAIKLGAFDFIEKPFAEDRLLDAIDSALALASDSRASNDELQELRERYDTLTDRQRDTMLLLVKGMGNKEIGTQLGISSRTVEIHRTWVMNKMAAKTLADLVRMGVALGLE